MCLVILCPGKHRIFMHVCALFSNYSLFLLGCLCGPVINSVFGRLCRKTASRGREDTWVWYRETMFSQMVSYHFPLYGPLHEYFLYLVSGPPPQKPRRGCEPEEGCLRCSKRFDHRSHSIIFLLFEFKSVDDVGAGKLREMLTLHSNPHAIRGRFTLKDDCERLWRSKFWILRIKKTRTKIGTLRISHKEFQSFSWTSHLGASQRPTWGK